MSNIILKISLEENVVDHEKRKLSTPALALDSWYLESIREDNLTEVIEDATILLKDLLNEYYKKGL